MEEPSILPSEDESYPLGKALGLSSVVWIVMVICLPNPSALVFLIFVLPLNLVLQRILVHLARRWPDMARRWIRTSLVSVLIFALPLQFAAWSQRTSSARFRQYVLDPIPSGVHDLSKREAMGHDGWIGLNFSITPQIVDTILRSRPFKPLDFLLAPAAEQRDYEKETRRRIGTWARDMDIESASIYLVMDRAAGESWFFIVASDKRRACFVYTRS